MSEPTIERLEGNLRAAQTEMAKALPTANGGQRAEQRYAAAYQALVKAGVRPQLRRKYRRRG